MLRLARGRVTQAGDPTAAEQRLIVELAGGPQPAIADTALCGPVQAGDEVLVNTTARELGLGSGGFDIVHANLTRGLDSQPAAQDHVLKLNYTSLQHEVDPLEAELPDELPPLPRRPVAVLALHSQLAPVAWAFHEAAPQLRLGYIQTAGGALPASRSQTAATLRTRGLLAAHTTAGQAFGGPDGEALSTVGALAHAFAAAGWHAAVAGPGPGIQGSGSALGHGGLAALDSAHAALALGLDVILVPRLSAADERSRHRGLSHHTRTVLRLLLAPVTMPLEGPADLDGYARSGLPAELMGRSLAVEAPFFTAALASGAVLAQRAAALA
jgi:hypothetical protein